MNCERCNEYALIFLDGKVQLCWFHYCMEMDERNRADEEDKDQQGHTDKDQSQL